MKPLQTYKTFDIVTIPFPFCTDARTKIRPALVLSSQDFFNNVIEHSVMAMITSSRNPEWPHDIHITALANCGLNQPSVIRFKLFTIDNRLIRNQIGQLSKVDQKRVRENVALIFNDFFR